MLDVVFAFILGAVFGCGAALWWIRSVFRDPAKLAAFAGLSGMDLDSIVELLLLGAEKKEQEGEQGEEQKPSG